MAVKTPTWSAMLRGSYTTMPNVTLQAYRYVTTPWFDAYHRRNQVESTNADLRTHVFSIGRGCTRVFGTAKNGLLMALALACSNVEVLRN